MLDQRMPGEPDIEVLARIKVSIRRSWWSWPRPPWDVHSAERGHLILIYSLLLAVRDATVW